jgi:MFS family permease
VTSVLGTAEGTLRPRVQRARAVTALTFAFNGLIFAAWVPHIPQVKADLGLSDAALGFALLGPAVGAVLAMTVIGRLITRHSSARMTTITAFGTYAFIIGPGLARNLGELFVALLLWGLANGSLDVSMNAQAVQIENAYRRPIMSSFHAFWSVGTILGTVIGGIGAGAGLALATQQAVLAALIALATVVWLRFYLADAPVRRSAPGSRVFEVRLLLLGVAGLCAMLAEGAAADWSPVYLRDDLTVSAGRAGLAFTAFTVTMTVGRMLGDRVVLRLGRQSSLVLLSTVGAVGMSAGLISNTVIGASIGFACLGIGLSIMVPVFFSTGADGPGEAGPKLAVVSSVSYVGFLIGPAALGPIASATSVHDALWLLPTFAALAGASGVLAVRMTARVVRPCTA